MQKALIWLSVLLVVVFGGKQLVDYMSRSSHENAATTRVERFWKGIAPGGDYQDAFNMWETGETGAIQRMSQDEYNAEVSRLNAWLTAQKLDRVTSYEVTAATLVAPPQGLEQAVVAVSCLVNGKALTILAVKHQRLAWQD
jgi:hypothetical protein